MGFFETILINERDTRDKVDVSNFESPENVRVGEGGHKSVVRSPNGHNHNYVLKSHDVTENYLRERERALREVDRVPGNDVLVGDDRAIIRMRESEMSHYEAVEAFGLSRVIEEDFSMFSDLVEDYIIYEDFKPANIGYFHSCQNPQEFEDVEAMPIDLYDIESLDHGSVSLLDFQKIVDVYLSGNSDFSGLTGNYEVSAEKAEELIVGAISDNPEEINSSKFKGVEDATREFYRKNLR